MWREQERSGRYGTVLEVDFDLCLGDGACIEVCPAGVFRLQGKDAGKKAMPGIERDCIYRFGCKVACPEFAMSYTGEDKSY